MRKSTLVFAIVSLGAFSQAGDTSYDAAGVERLKRDLQIITGAAQASVIQKDLDALMPNGQIFKPAQAAKLSADLTNAIAGKRLSDGDALHMAIELNRFLHFSGSSTREVQSMILDIQDILTGVAATPDSTKAVTAAMRTMVRRTDSPLVPDVPTRPYRFPISAAPKYERSVMIEDFESGSIFPKWYSPKWSIGLNAVLDPAHKESGRFGLLLIAPGPADRRTSLAYPPKPYVDMRGMNAVRMWIQPYGGDPKRGMISTGYLDGKGQIWQVDLPDVVSGTEPFILELALADIRRGVRLTDGIIDMKCSDYCFWSVGAYKITVDNIMFVYDPTLPEFKGQVCPSR
jgi:hypothetical protein